MGVITLRLNEKEEKILQSLQTFFDEDKSKILKEAMMDMYEDIQDRDVIETFEKNYNSGKVHFQSADDLIKKIKSKTK